MVEMREFKVAAENVVQDLVAKQKLQSTDLTKGVMETAAGIRMWASLRAVSDAVLFDRIKKNGNLVGKGIPCFTLTSNLEESKSNKSRSLSLPAKANICPKALERATRALKCHIIHQEEEFTQTCILINKEQL